MSDISKIKVSGVEYGIKDIQAREDLGNLGTRVTELEQHGGGGSVPKPLTYDYMPEGYPSKSVQTVPLIADTNVELTIYNDYGIGTVNDFFDDANIVVGKQYVVNLDGSKYNVTAEPGDGITYIGNLILFTITQLNASYDETKTFLDENSIPYTEEPFCIIIVPSSSALKNQLIVRSTDASHTIGVSAASELITPMAEEFLPILTSPNGTKYKITVDDSGTLSATEVTA